MGKLFLFILFVGFCDVYLVVISAKYLTVLGAIGLCLLTAFLGSYLVRREGFKVLMEIQNDFLSGKPPVDRMIDGVLILIGGALLITPGFITDFMGFMLLLPFVRKIMRPLVIKCFKNKVKFNTFSTMGGQATFYTNFPKNPNSNAAEKDADVIDVK